MHADEKQYLTAYSLAKALNPKLLVFISVHQGLSAFDNRFVPKSFIVFLVVTGVSREVSYGSKDFQRR